MCVYLPAWPLQRLVRQQPAWRNEAVALAAPGRRGPEVVCCSAQARRLGVRPRMPVAEALAVHPALRLADQDAAGDQRALVELALWAMRYSPLVGLDDGPAPQGLLLDISGGAACFGGAEALLRQAAQEFRADGWRVWLALADTLGAAWALARYGRAAVCHVPAGDLERWLRPLPVAALRLPPPTVWLFARLGIERIEQLLALPRASIPERFGPLVLQRVDQALGRWPEMIAPCRCVPDIAAVQTFETPTECRQTLQHALTELTGQVQAALERRGWGARRLECQLRREAAAPVVIDVGLLRPSACPQHLGLLLQTRFEQVQVAGAVSELRLRVVETGPAAAQQGELFAADSPTAQARLAALIDQLSMQLGRQAVTRVRLLPDWQPEEACRLEPVLGERGADAPRGKVKRRTPEVPPGADAPRSPELPLRPLQLFLTPVRLRVWTAAPDGRLESFRQAGTTYRVIRSWGPERIATGWWRRADVQRDYYMTATDQGCRFWVFRCRRSEHWFLHGCYE